MSDPTEQMVDNTYANLKSTVIALKTTNDIHMSISKKANQSITN
jgi:hypothetical protein